MGMGKNHPLHILLGNAGGFETGGELAGTGQEIRAGPAIENGPAVSILEQRDVQHRGRGFRRQPLLLQQREQVCFRHVARQHGHGPA